MENNGRLLQQQQQQQLAFAQQQAFAPLAQQMLTNPSLVSVHIVITILLKCQIITDENVIKCIEHTWTSFFLTRSATSLSIVKTYKLKSRCN